MNHVRSIPQLSLVLLSLLLPKNLFCAEEDRDDSFHLFRDLEEVKRIDTQLADHLPVYYNTSMMGGYFIMPSARMEKSGEIAFGASIAKPYDIYGLNFQVFDRLELSLNYRVYTGILEQNFGKEGFGDDAERIGNVKLGLLTKKDGFPALPEISVGIEDFIGTKRFNAQYGVLTKQFLEIGLECSFGWGHGRIKGPFGGFSWTPLRDRSTPFFKDLSIVAEYDATNYKKHCSEHPQGREVNSRINAGLAWLGWDTIQLSLSSLRGKTLAGTASLRYPLGSSHGLFTKTGDPAPYKSPVNTEPLGIVRSESTFIQELAYAFSEQGLDLYLAFLEPKEGILYLKIINNRYREIRMVRERLRHVLASLLPSNISLCHVLLEEGGVDCQTYTFRRKDLTEYKAGVLSDFEMDVLSSPQEAIPLPSEYEAIKLFERRKPIWTFTIRPRLLSFFGSSTGKFKYNLGVLASPEGYIFNQVYYKLQMSYSVRSSMQNLTGTDKLNPSRLPIVRSDSLRYFQTNSFSMEQAYMQRSWNLGRGVFYRFAGGYFEPAYGGGAMELLYFPVNSNWAVGGEAAVVWKRHYHGVKFRRTTYQLKGNQYEIIPFLGVQYFLDVYYDFKPLSIDFLVTAGQFLAKDKGARLDVGRYFKSGLRFSVWCTWTNGHDQVNGHTYFDKGFSFMIPLDFFLRKSSRNYVGYAMSAWLRDVGAQACTGKKLYETLQEARLQKGAF